MSHNLIPAYTAVTGYINLVQEQRFRLILDDGRSLILLLGRKAPIDVNRLIELKRTRARVRVRFAGEANQASGIACAVQQVDKLEPEEKHVS